MTNDAFAVWSWRHWLLVLRRGEALDSGERRQRARGHVGYLLRSVLQHHEKGVGSIQLAGYVGSPASEKQRVGTTQVDVQMESRMQ